MRWPLVIGLVAGCDQAFGLTHYDPDAAPPDSRIIDACIGSHDEDLDGIPDACDGCPTAVGNDDKDGDGLGDACDPFPLIPGDSIAVFDGFGGASMIWNGDGTWAIGADALRHSTPTLSIDTVMVPSTAHATVDSSFIYVLGADQAYVGVELIVDSTPTACLVSRPSVGVEQLSLFSGTTMEGSPVAFAPGPGPMRLQLSHREDTTFLCVASRAGFTVNVSGGASIGTTTGVGFVAYNASIDASSITVLTR